jgi:hypothetical protein
MLGPLLHLKKKQSPLELQKESDMLRLEPIASFAFSKEQSQ